MVIKVVLVQMLALVVFLFMFRKMSFPRYVVVGYAFLLTGGLVAGKVAIRSLYMKLHKRGRSNRRMVIFDANVHGFMGDEPKPTLNGQYLGKIGELENMLSAKIVDEVVVTLTANQMQQIRVCDNHLALVKILSVRDNSLI